MVIAIIGLVVLIAGPWVSSAIRNQFNTVAGTLGNGIDKGSWETGSTGGGNGSLTDADIVDPVHGTAFAVYSADDHSLMFYKRKCSSLLGSLCSVGSLCGGDIICGLGLGQLLVGCSLGIGRGLYIGLTCLSVGGCLIVCGLGVGLCRLCGIHGGLRGIELLVCLVQLALGEIHGRLGILYGLLGDLLDVGLGG